MSDVVENLPDDITACALSLTVSERECFDWVRPCSGIAPYRDGADGIWCKGLVAKDHLGWFHITPLGLQVRKALKGTRHD